MKISNEEIRLINALHSFSGITAKDCLILGNNVVFLVKENQMGAVIGKNGSVIKNLREKSKKRIEVFAFSETPQEFIRKALRGIRVESTELKENKGRKELEVKLDSENKRKIASFKGTLKRIKELMERNYKVNDIKIR